MIRSLASCRASSAAASAVASSGYPIAIKSAITPSLPSPASNPTQSTNPAPAPPHPPRVIPAQPAGDSGGAVATSNGQAWLSDDQIGDISVVMANHVSVKVAD